MLKQFVSGFYFSFTSILFYVVRAALQFTHRQTDWPHITTVAERNFVLQPQCSDKTTVPIYKLTVTLRREFSDMVKD